MDLRKIFQISLIKTIRMNLHYFGVGGVVRPIIIASRNLMICRLSGTVDAQKTVGSIKIGFGSVAIVDSKYNRSIWDNVGNITFRGSAHFGPGTRISCGGNLVFGNNIAVNANSDIVCKKEIVFEDDCLISWDCLIMDTDFHEITDGNNNIINCDRPIKIGEHSWIGCRSAVLKGVTIPRGAVVGANSLITKSLSEENGIYRDHECIRHDVRWKM